MPAQSGGYGTQQAQQPQQLSGGMPSQFGGHNVPLQLPSMTMQPAGGHHLKTEQQRQPVQQQQAAQIQHQQPQALQVQTQCQLWHSGSAASGIPSPQPQQFMILQPSGQLSSQSLQQPQHMRQGSEGTTASAHGPNSQSNLATAAAGLQQPLPNPPTGGCELGRLQSVTQSLPNPPPSPGFQLGTSSSALTSSAQATAPGALQPAQATTQQHQILQVS